MLHRHRWINWVTSFLFIFVVSSCDGLGTGCGCSVQPLPQGGLPADQTIEGGAQVRITPAGFSKITALIPAVINDAVAGGFCIPQDRVVNIGVAEADICATNVGSCSPGCPVSVNLDSATITANDKTLNLRMQFDVQANVHIDYEVFWVVSGSCDTTFNINNGVADISVELGINANTGELELHPASINNLNININQGSGCAAVEIVTAAVNLFMDLLDTFVGDLFLPLIDNYLQGLLPDPLGIEGLIDVGALTGSVSPGTNATVELRGVPGGFVELVGNGLTLGVIIGANADEDIATRTPDLDSEPAYCVPPLAAPDFAAAPNSLPKSARGTFTLLAAEEFRGAPDPAGDVAIGLSETTLDLLGHHAITSGAMCLGVGTALIPELDLGRIGLLVPSLAELGNPDGHDPLLLITRPLKPIDFTIGEGTAASPSLTIHLHDFEIDFYAFLYERYMRGFTVGMDMDVGINLEFTTTAEGKPAILPVLTGLTSDNIQVTALNTEFLRESSAELEATLPAVLELALPLITSGLEPFELPELAGFGLGNLQIGKVVTSEDEFLAIFATMVASQQMREMAERYPSLGQVLGPVEMAPQRAETRATLRSVNTPAIERVRASMLGQPGGLRPEIVIDVAPTDELGRPLEYTWNINGGMWRPFSSAAPLVIRDPALVWQSRFDIGVRARVAGDYRTLDLEPVTIPVVIDSVGPRVLAGEMRLDGNAIAVPATDLVSPEGIELAFGHPGDDAPATDWTQGGLSLDDARSLALQAPIAGQDGSQKPAQMVTVYARDQHGNVSKSLVDVSRFLPHHGQTSGGCACAAGAVDGRSVGGLGLLAGLTLLLLWATGRRRGHRPLAQVRASDNGTRVRASDSDKGVRGSRRWRALRNGLLYTGLVIGAALMPACDCGGAPAASCEIDADCDDYCPVGTLGVCLDNTCLCQDVPGVGRIGQYSDMALSSGGTVWVSAYNSSYGDLNVASFSGEGVIPDDAWQFADGVPDGPVVADPERAPFRGGVAAAGPNVGKYTSIAINAQDEVMVSYYDSDTASLKFASNIGGEWQSHTVAEGVRPSDPEVAFEALGQYSSITIGADGRPGIAYFAHVSEGAGSARTEVRYASAQSIAPASAADWNTYVIDEAALPATDPNDVDPLRIPPGVGLFVTSVRQSDQTPAVVYYDRLNGDLKAARFSLTDGTFLSPEVLDDGDGADVGWYPSVAIDDSDVLHVTYVSATNDDLLYINTADAVPEIVDDGYRIVGTTEDGLPKPEYHLVGDDSSLVLTNVGPVVVYQNATTHELLMSKKGESGLWEFTTIAGNEAEFAGGFGFYAAAGLYGEEVIMSTWVLDPPNSKAWVQVFRQSVAVQ